MNEPPRQHASADLRARLAAAETVAREAGMLGRRLLADRARLAIETKGPQDFVTSADRALQDFIVERLSAAFPGDSFVGEEADVDPSVEARDTVWVIDPIDGTANFIRGRDAWCVSIGFLLEGRPAIGVIYHPADDDLFSAAVGQGAHRNGRRISVSDCGSMADATITFEYSPKTPPAAFLPRLGWILKSGGEFRRNGSAALSLAYVADGRLDGFIELHIYAWDILAGLVLVEEAGGWTSDFFAAGDLATGRAFIAAAPGIRDEFLALTKPPAAKRRPRRSRAGEPTPRHAAPLDWLGRSVDQSVPALTEIALPVREAMRDGPLELATHTRYFSEIPALREIELGGGEPARASATGVVRVAVWNVERLRHGDAIAGILVAHRPDVVLLSEVDKGMVRSGNRHGLADLSRALGHHYAYGVEFVELGFGDPDEARANSGRRNALGFHGNAVTSAIRLHRPFMVRLEADGGWFGPTRGQQRVGGRMAIGAQIELVGRRVTLVSVHLESNSSPAGRKAQIVHLLDVIEKYDADAPLVVGGDLNTSTIDRARDRDREFQRPEFASDPQRLLAVEPYEPLFAEMAARGFDWRAANVEGAPTERPQPGQPMRPLGKIDWIFTRGLHASAPAIVPALAPDGASISDHDCLLVTIALSE